MERKIHSVTEWWKNDPDELLRYVYWCQGQLPPINKDTRDKEWKSIKKQLTEKYGDGKNDILKRE